MCSHRYIGASLGCLPPRRRLRLESGWQKVGAQHLAHRGPAPDVPWARSDCQPRNDQPTPVYITLPCRLESIGVVEAAWFDRLVLVTILVNCATMVWESPLDPEGTWKAELIDVAELVPPA